jgi:prepilin-type processing-associated H-X9-DG protein
MREELRVRMPDLANAPLLEARVCQYEDTPDKNLLIDRHPEAANVWFVGGGFRTRVQVSPGPRRARRTTRLGEAAAEGPVPALQK